LSTNPHKRNLSEQNERPKSKSNSPTKEVYRTVEESISKTTSSFKTPSYSDSKRTEKTNDSKVKKNVLHPVKKEVVEIFVNKRKKINLMENDVESKINTADSSKVSKDESSFKPPLIIKEKKNIYSDKKAKQQPNKEYIFTSQFEELHKGPVVKKHNISQQLSNYTNSKNEEEKTINTTTNEKHDFSFSMDQTELINETKMGKSA